MTDAEWARVFEAFGPNLPTAEELARRVRNPALAPRGMELLRRFDIVDRLDRITCSTLVCVGRLDPVTPVEASREIVAGLAPGIATLEVLEGAGHFPWLDVPNRFWAVMTGFIAGR